MSIDDQASTFIVEGFNGTHGQPLGVIALAGGEEGLEGVVGGDDEAGGVDEELSSNVEEDQEEVEGTEAKDDVDLGHIGLLLELLQLRVLGQLLVELGQVELGYNTVVGQSRLERVVRADSCECNCNVPLSWIEPPWALMLAIMGDGMRYRV